MNVDTLSSWFAVVLGIVAAAGFIAARMSVRRQRARDRRTP